MSGGVEGNARNIENYRGLWVTSGKESPKQVSSPARSFN
jgi:hypothetical protein